MALIEREITSPQTSLDARISTIRGEEAAPTHVNSDLMRSVLQTGWKWWAVLIGFGGLFGVGVLTFVYQLYDGMGAWGMNRPIYWGLDIANFIFWAGVALSGTMISAILRLLHAGWRRSLTRMTETLTLCALAVAGVFPLLHIGRNWVFQWFIPYPNNLQLWPNYRSPLIWDASALTVYLITSALFWYGGLIPDFATLRDRTIGIRKMLFGALSLGWRGSDREWRRLKVLFGILTVLIIPVFVSLHTIVGWDFGMSIVPGWHETIFAPYFVCGALYSGCGAVLIIMCLVRRAFHLEEYIQPMHFDNIGKIQFAISLLWFYFFAGDAWSDWFTRDPAHLNWLHLMFNGYKWVLATILFFGLAVPFSILGFGKLRRMPWVMFAVGISVNIAMFAERVTVVVPPVSRNILTWGNYTPGWVDIAYTAAAYGLFGFLYTLLTKFIPIVSLWEYKEADHAEGIERVGNGEMPVTIREEAIA